jgi:hypothetical protein
MQTLRQRTAISHYLRTHPKRIDMKLWHYVQRLFRKPPQNFIRAAADSLKRYRVRIDDGSVSFEAPVYCSRDL